MYRKPHPCRSAANKIRIGHQPQGRQGAGPRRVLTTAATRRRSNRTACTAHVRFRGKADMTLYGNPLSRSLLGVKRTWLVAAHMSAFDPKRTSTDPLLRPNLRVTGPRLGKTVVNTFLGSGNETARVHHACWWRGSMADHDVCATARRAAAHRCPDDVAR